MSADGTLPLIEPVTKPTRLPAVVAIPEPKPAPVPDEGVEWRWNDPAQASAIVYPTSLAVAVYRNPDGDLVIRQQADWNDEGDAVIVVPRDRLELFALSVQNEVD